MREFGDDKLLLAWVALQCQQHLAADENGKGFLRRNGVTDENVWAAYRVGTGNADLPAKLTDADKQRLHKLKLLMWNGVFNLARSGVCIPTFDPRQPNQPVGIIRCAVAQNKHHFATTPAGIGCTAD